MAESGRVREDFLKVVRSDLSFAICTGVYYANLNKRAGGGDCAVPRRERTWTKVLDMEEHGLLWCSKPLMHYYYSHGRCGKWGMKDLETKVLH